MNTTEVRNKINHCLDEADDVLLIEVLRYLEEISATEKNFKLTDEQLKEIAKRKTNYATGKSAVFSQEEVREFVLDKIKSQK